MHRLYNFVYSLPITQPRILYIFLLFSIQSINDISSECKYLYTLFEAIFNILLIITVLESLICGDKMPKCQEKIFSQKGLNPRKGARCSPTDDCFE